jgi:hypothetical protein
LNAYASTRVEVDAKQEGSSLIAHIGGGTSPYRVSVSFEPKDVKGVENIPSKDGWVVVPLASAQKATKATLEIIDAKDAKTTKTVELKPPSETPVGDTSKSEAPPAPPVAQSGCRLNNNMRRVQSPSQSKRISKRISKRSDRA